MKKISNLQFLTVLIASFFISFANAQDSQKAKNLLNEVTQKIKSYDNIHIEFKYAYTNLKENQNQESRGVAYMKADQYLVEFMGMTELSDGKMKYTIVPEDEEISISKIDKNNQDSFTPARLLTFFNKGFVYHWDIVQNVNGKKIQYIKLKPTDSKDSRKEVLLGIDTKTKHIYNLIETRKDNSKVVFTINSFKTNQPLSKNHFTFVESKYPNYYINRLD